MAKIKSARTAAFVVNLMAGDGQPGSIAALGDADPAMVLDVGQSVEVLGPPSTNAHKVSYTPINVAGKGDAVYWVRSSSIDTAPATPEPTSAKTPASSPARSALIPATKSTGIPWWVFAIAGVGVVGVGGYIGWRLSR